ncbi:MAG: hypothetical protein ACP5QA_15765 [Phycisphaerae bacterium]
MKQIQFFATREDLLLVLGNVERDTALRYVRTGNQLNPHFETFQRGGDIPNLGVADRETGSVCRMFLITGNAVTVGVRTVKGADGIQRYLVDQLLNPDTVTLTPAGMWGEDTLLQGVVGTASDSVGSRELMKAFKSAFGKSFVKVQGRFVGPQAMALLNCGRRLAIAAQSPRDFDLVASGSAKREGTDCNDD